MPSSAPPSPLPVAGPRPLRILVVEDESDALAATLEMIVLLGHWATGVRSAEGARDRFIDGIFDVVLTDVALPGLSGFDLVDMLRARHTIQVIFASGSAAPARLANNAVWLQKPFGIDALEQALLRVQAA